MDVAHPRHRIREDVMIDSLLVDRPVVAGVDGTPYALDAAEFAARYARLHGYPLLIVRAVDWPSVDAPVDPKVTDRIGRDLRMAADRDLEAATARARQAAGAIDIRTRVELAGAAATLVGASAGAAAVVVGAHGRSGLLGVLAGSVAVQVATHASGVVLIARGHAVSGADIVLGTDGSAHSAPATAFAFEEAAARGVGITAVHAWRHPISTGPGDLLPLVVERNQAEETRVLVEALGNWAPKHPEVPVRHLVVRGSAARALVDASAGAQMVVVGARGHGGFAGLLLGSVGQALLHRAACPVAIVRPA
jgi:nucleotide-binding universal stress UspA family protein